MKAFKKRLSMTAWGLIGSTLLAQAQAATLWQESFETDGSGGARYTQTEVCNDGSSDFFTRTDGSDINAGYVVTGQDGSFYFAAQDTDGSPCTLTTETVTFNAIDISGKSNLSFSGLFAEDDSGDANEDWDADALVYVEYNIDNGGWNKLIQFASQGATNTEPGLDTNFDGVRDGAALTPTMTQYAQSIPGSGSSLALRITVDQLQAGDEDIAFDNFTITADASASSSSDANTSSSPSSSSSAPVSSSSSEVSSSSSSSSAPAITLIHDVQGNGSASPIVNEVVAVEGIVVGDFQDTLGGFFVQEEDADADADPETSEGIFVYSSTAVAVADKVEVTGTVKEYFDLTELGSVTDVTVVSGGNTLPTPAPVQLPFTSDAEKETVEGMAVAFAQPLFVTEHYQLSRYGQVRLSGTKRLDQPTNVVAPGAAANALQAANDLNQILLDDGSKVQNPDPVIFSNNPPNPLSAADTLRGGDSVTGLNGVMYYSYGSYAVLPTSVVNFVNANPRPATPPSLNGSLSVAAFNVLNFFTTLDDSGPICGPSANLGCRGADSAEELTRQRDKLLSALNALDADVIGLMELENTHQNAIADLASNLPGYAFVANPDGNNTALGDDAITVGILFKTATVQPVGTSATVADGFGSTSLGEACDAGADGVFAFDDYNRKPLAQTFEQRATGETFTVVVNHFKSKGSLTPYMLDIDQGDGQGNDNCTRTLASRTLLEWLATHPTGSMDPDTLVMGDLNAYAMEDSIGIFTDMGYTNLAHGYSYVFDGQWGSLDHVLASSSMSPQVKNAEKWHINADEPNALDYNTDFKSAGQVISFYNNDAFRTSDHDPVIIGLDLGKSAAIKTLPNVLMYMLGN